MPVSISISAAVIGRRVTARKTEGKSADLDCTTSPVTTSAGRLALLRDCGPDPGACRSPSSSRCADLTTTTMRAPWLTPSNPEDKRGLCLVKGRQPRRGTLGRYEGNLCRHRMARRAQGGKH